MKFSQNAKAALAQPDTKTVTVEMTPERKELYSRMTHEIVDLLRANTKSPLEGYMIMQFVVHSFEDLYGIRGGIIVDRNDEGAARA
jgi:hypothetical protein